MPETQEQTLARIANIDTNVATINTSLVGIGEDIASLKDQVAAGATSEEVTAALDALGSKVVATAEVAGAIDAETPGA